MLEKITCPASRPPLGCRAARLRREGLLHHRCPTEIGGKTSRRHGADHDYARIVTDHRPRCRAKRNCNLINAYSASVSLPVLKFPRSPVEVRV